MAFVSCTKLDTDLATKQDALVDCDGNPIPAGTAVALCSDIPPEVNVSDEGVDSGAAAVTDLNFVGAGVTASQVGGVVTVTIPGAIGGLTTVATDSPIIGDGTPGNPIRLDPVALCAYIAANCGGVTPTYCPTQPLLDGGFGYLAADPKDPAATVEIAPCDGSEPSIWIYPTSGVGHTVPVLDCSSSVIGYGADASSCAVPLVSC